MDALKLLEMLYDEAERQKQLHARAVENMDDKKRHLHAYAHSVLVVIIEKTTEKIPA